MAGVLRPLCGMCVCPLYVFCALSVHCLCSLSALSLLMLSLCSLSLLMLSLCVVLCGGVVRWVVPRCVCRWRPDRSDRGESSKCNTSTTGHSGDRVGRHTLQSISRDTCGCRICGCFTSFALSVCVPVVITSFLCL